MNFAPIPPPPEITTSGYSSNVIVLSLILIAITCPSVLICASATSFDLLTKTVGTDV